MILPHDLKLSEIERGKIKNARRMELSAASGGTSLSRPICFRYRGFRVYAVDKDCPRDTARANGTHSWDETSSSLRLSGGLQIVIDLLPPFFERLQSQLPSMQLNAELVNVTGNLGAL